RQRVADRALLAVRRHHVHLAERGERLRQRAQAGRVDAVVVGHEDYWRHVSGRALTTQHRDPLLRAQKRADPRICWYLPVEMVGAIGFEPATPCPPVKCAPGLRHAPTQHALYESVAGNSRRAARSPRRETLAERAQPVAEPPERIFERDPAKPEV